MCHVACVMWHVLCVMWHASCVMCQVSGNPRPSVEWTRLGGDINGVDDVKHSLTNMVGMTIISLVYDLMT